MLVIITIHTNWRDERQCKAHDFLILGGKQQSKHNINTKSATRHTHELVIKPSGTDSALTNLV